MRLTPEPNYEAMQKVYFLVCIYLCLCTITPNFSSAQNCASLTATAVGYESRCAATGSIKIEVQGGSGSFKYKVSGPINSNYTTSDSITGLSAGSYTITINDIVNNCTITKPGIIVTGSYQDPRFTLNGAHITCDNGNNGSITVTGQQFGRSPFSYTIVAPSPMGIGTSNSSGLFNDLIAGDYSIRLTDSCGGIQTRSITLNNYTWLLDSYPFSKISCDSAKGNVKVVDSRGNVSTVNGVPGFTYGIIRQPGDTIWSASPSFRFALNGANTFEVVARDACGKIKKGNSPVKFISSVGANISIANKTCSTFSASVANIVNLFNGNYCIYSNANVLLSCNGAGSFTDLTYGAYCITAKDACTDTTITRCFSVQPPTLSVASTVSITAKNCNSFTATVTGQTGLTNPEYCVVNSANEIIVCNNTGSFSNLAYGAYCIKVKDNCRDTTISRCINIVQPVPKVPATISPAYTTCSNFGISVGGDSLYKPQFCLFDSIGSVLTCNNTGVFDSLTFGNYCVKVYDSCYDTTITRCFTSQGATITNDLTTAISNKTCSTFTVKATSARISSPQFCLYLNDSLIGCNTTGTFNLVPNGTYCVNVLSTCPDMTFTKCFTVTPPVPSVGSTVAITSRTCVDFTAKVSGQKNLTLPMYCLFNAENVQVACNKTGEFKNLPYGEYCIQTTNTCFDTVITRCFNAVPIPVDMTVTTSKSCSYGYATMNVTIIGGSLPVNFKVYRPDSTVLFDRNFNSSPFTLDSIPGVEPGLVYKVVATDACEIADSLDLAVTASIASHVAQVIAQCPSALWQNGSGKIQAKTATNMGVFTVKIVKKNGTLLSPELTPNTASGGVYTFNDLGTGTYIISYKLNDLCNKYLYDTVFIAPYTYPNLDRSSAYQCNVSGFSVGAVANNGVGPFSYEIIGSNPASPAISTMPQSSPVFNIDNGFNYSLIRLRALDACGNATLADASILPLAGYKIIVDSNCFQSSSTLSVDTIYNASYSWYKKERANSTDSILVGGGYSLHIPFLSAGDTGTYVCHIMVNSGCVNRSYQYNLNGLCYNFLPITIKDFSGKFEKERVKLSWKAVQDIQLKAYVIERKTSGNSFVEIGRIIPGEFGPGNWQYEFTDANPGRGENQYRIRLVSHASIHNLSSTIFLTPPIAGGLIRAYPNPATDLLTITFESAEGHKYRVQLLTLANQVVFDRNINSRITRQLYIPRETTLSRGIYLLKCYDLNSNQTFVQKIVFE